MNEYQGLSVRSVYLPLQYSKGSWIAELVRPNPKYDFRIKGSKPSTIDEVPVCEIYQDVREAREIISYLRLKGEDIPSDIIKNFNSLSKIVRQIPFKVQKHSERILPKLNISF